MGFRVGWPIGRVGFLVGFLLKYLRGFRCVLKNPWSSKLTSISGALGVCHGLVLGFEDLTVNRAPAPQPQNGPRRDVLFTKKDL